MNFTTDLLRQMAFEAGIEITKNQHGNEQFRCFSTEIDRFAKASAAIALREVNADLLAALRELLAMCERQRDFDDDGDGGMFERARAAIAQAGHKPAGDI